MGLVCVRGGHRRCEGDGDFFLDEGWMAGGAPRRHAKMACASEVIHWMVKLICLGWVGHTSLRVDQKSAIMYNDVDV